VKSEVHVVVPAGIDDPLRPSGGNVYDRRLCEELPAWGWTVHEHAVPGAWPTPDPADRAPFAELLLSLPDDALVVVDGLIASAAEELVDAARRVRVVVLLHMPDATAHVETAVLNAAAGVITTSQWSRDRIVSSAKALPDRAWCAVPGVDQAAPAAGTTPGRNLLVVGPVTAAKGHDVLVAALAKLTDLEWRCTCAGALDLDPDFVESLTAAAEDAGLADRLLLTGPLSRSALSELRSQMDLLISPSRRESYGMAVIEALAGGIPVVATDVGGHREALGRASNGTMPGYLLPMDDVDGLADILRRWLTEPELRDRWRQSAELRGRDLPSWSETAQTVADVLEAIRRKPDAGRAEV
jgi:glycosyltransferase involved in cell wall biosynthesis